MPSPKGMRRGKPTTQAATKKRRQEQQHDTPTPARKAGKLGDLLAPAATVTKEQLRQRAVYGAKLLLAIKRICDLCGPKQGRILSKDARGILLIVVFMVQYLLMCSRTMAIKIVAQLCHVSARCTLEPLANHWDEVGDVLVTTGSSRGVGGLNHPLATKMLQAIHLNSIDKFIDDNDGKVRRFSTSHIRTHVRDSFNINLSRAQIRKVLHVRGYKWGKSKKMGKKFSRREQSQNRMKQFLLSMDEAFAAEADGDAVIIYQDESYIHENHASNYGWYKSKIDVDGKEIGMYTSQNAKGQRLILVHTITKDGPVAKRDESGYPIKEDAINGTTEELPTAEWIFKAGTALGDYHKNMDGEMFMKWIRERLLPAVEKLYPDKKVYFVLDNAPYHHHVSGGYDISKANKTQLAQWMVKEGCEEFYDPEAAKTFKVDKAWGHHQTRWRTQVPRAPHGPSTDNMKRGFHNWLKANKPKLVTEDLVTFARDHDWHLIFTPPYCPKLQPIELYWACGKNFVARCYTDRRKFADIPEQLRTGWYGGEDIWGVPHSPCDCGKLVAHARKEMDKEVAAVGWAGTVGRLDREACPMPPNPTVPFGLTPMTDDNLFFGDVVVDIDDMGDRGDYNPDEGDDTDDDEYDDDDDLDDDEGEYEE